MGARAQLFVVIGEQIFEQSRNRAAHDLVQSGKVTNTANIIRDRGRWPTHGALTTQIGLVRCALPDDQK